MSSILTSSDPNLSRPVVVDGSSTGKLRPVARPISDGAMPISPRSGKQVPPLVLAAISDEPLHCVEAVVASFDQDAALTSFNGAAGSIARLMGRQAARSIFAEANLSVAANIIAAVIAGAAIVYILQSYLAQQ